MKERCEDFAVYILGRVLTFSALAPGYLAGVGDAIAARVRGRPLEALEVPQALEPRRLTIEDHWAKVTGVIAAAIAGFRRVELLQVAASRQIDAADYALQVLLRDLVGTMPIAADGSELRALLAEAERPPEAKKAIAA